MAFANTLSTTRMTWRERLDGFRAARRERAAQYATYRRVHDELSAMSDRELADIGISRIEIGDVARQASGRA
ncbi:DUF1127 domain-containing protein [Oceaniglobus roseus]|uniref:DUF1127 domain-containing protein n=1 Tax=Oceaniglobus roseus TaxID=1737570 RepID=UPI000C7F2542|nr:DUF1127 domain-containing protein [Kandeliimicrobium roseum]